METLKVVLAMLALVMIGFIGGFATHRHLAKERIHDIARMHRPHGLVEQLRKSIRPNEAQIAEIRPIFQEWSKEMQAIRTIYNQEKIAKLDTLIRRVKPLLENEQVERLDKRFQRIKNKSLRAAKPLD